MLRPNHIRGYPSPIPKLLLKTFNPAIKPTSRCCPLLSSPLGHRPTSASLGPRSGPWGRRGEEATTRGQCGAKPTCHLTKSGFHFLKVPEPNSHPWMWSPGAASFAWRIFPCVVSIQAELKHAHILNYPQCLTAGLSFSAVLDTGHNSAVIGTNRRVKGRGTCGLETTGRLHTAAPQLPQGSPRCHPKIPCPRT